MDLRTFRTSAPFVTRLLAALCFALIIGSNSYAEEPSEGQPSVRPNLGWLTFAQIVAQPSVPGQMGVFPAGNATANTPSIKFNGTTVALFAQTNNVFCIGLNIPGGVCDFMFYQSGGLNFRSDGGVSWAASTDATGGAVTLLTNNGLTDNLSFARSKAPMRNFVTGDTSTASTSLAVIPGLSWNTNLSTTAAGAQMHFDCYGQYSIATAVAAVDFGIQVTVVAPTQVNATGMQWTNVGAVTPVAGVVTALNTTTATSITSATPAAINTNYPFELHGFIEHPGASGQQSVTQIMFKTAAGADSVTVKRGSYCTVF